MVDRCAFESCKRPPHRNGLCFSHYHQQLASPHLRVSRGRIPQSEERADREVDGVLIRFCRSCPGGGAWKPLDQFEKRETCKLGHTRMCKVCVSQRRSTRQRASRTLDRAIQIVETAKNRADTLEQLRALKASYK